MHLHSWCINKRNFSVAMCSFFLYKNWIIICRDLSSPKFFGSLCSSGSLISNVKTLYTSKENTFDVPLSVFSSGEGQTFSFVTKPMNKTHITFFSVINLICYWTGYLEETKNFLKISTGWWYFSFLLLFLFLYFYDIITANTHIICDINTSFLVPVGHVKKGFRCIFSQHNWFLGK